MYEKVAKTHSIWFSFWGICIKVIYSNRGINSNTWSRYGIRLGCLVSQSPFIWCITNAESPYTSRISIINSMATLIPMMHASYSMILVVQPKHSFAVKDTWKFFRVVNTAPIPWPTTLEACESSLESPTLLQ